MCKRHFSGISYFQLTYEKHYLMVWRTTNCHSRLEVAELKCLVNEHPQTNANFERF